METNKSYKKTVSDSKDLLMISLAKYYSNKQIINRIVPVIEGNSNLSLRLIDWFVTNYSKKHSTVIMKVINSNILHFNVYMSYRSQLKAYSKRQFDPFRRRDRITFHFEKNGKGVETTVGQLNFFRWVLQNEILDYIEKHYKDIEQDMVSTQKSNQDMKQNQSNIKVKVVATKEGETVTHRKKRNELSKSFIKNMNRFNGQRTIDFN